jgi:acyl transferase domain-containing protein
LSALARHSVNDEGRLFLGSLKPPGDDDWGQLLTSLAVLYAHGAEIDWEGFDRPYDLSKVAIPGYPFQRKSYYLNPVPDASGPTALGSLSKASPTAYAPDAEFGQLAQAAAADSRQALLPVINEIARTVLSDQVLPPLDEHLPLVEQGFTSLMAVELRKRLESVLPPSAPATFLFNYPSIGQIADFITAAWGTPAADHQDRQDDGNHLADEAGFEFLDQLSRAELEQLIERELNLR